MGFAKADNKSLFIAVQRVKIKRTEEGEVIRMVDRELLQAISNMLDSRFGGLETRFNKLDSRFGGLETRFNKIDSRFEEMEERFNKRLRSTENSILQQLDIVQEKSNNNYHMLEDKLEGLRVIVNGIKIDHDTVNLLSENVSNLHYEIHKLKIKLS